MHSPNCSVSHTIYDATNLKPAPEASVAPLLMRDPSLASVTHLPLLPALMVYTPLAAPIFWRIVKTSQVEAVARAAWRVKLPDWSAVTNWLLLVSLRLPALGVYELTKTPALA